ncbi:MAG: FG-GAP-like repeat-containing protein, partial [Gemmatimonadaceae bacterium]
MRLASLYRATIVLAAALVLGSCGGDSPTTPAPGPNQIAAASASSSVGTVGAIVADPPRVKVTSSTGAAVAGVAVTFAVTEGGGTLANASATTDANGIATAGTWTLGTTPGSNKVTAAATGISGTLTFTATAAAGPPAAIAFSRDSLLLDQWGDTLRVSVVVKDSYGNTLASPSVTWTSPDTAVATVTAGLATSVRVGRTLLQATATVGTQSFQSTIPARVVLQRNAACVAPTPVTRGAAQGVATYLAPEILTNLTSPTFPGRRTLAFDYDGDGDTDAIRLEYSYPTTTPYTGKMHVFKNDGGVLRDSTSRVMSSTVIPDHPRDFEIRDFTGDGVLDLYVAQHGFDAPPFPGAPNLFFTKSGNQLAQVAATRFANFSSAAFSHGSSSADVDCDGDIDLVELNVTPTIPNILWLNGGTGNFTAATSK